MLEEARLRWAALQWETAREFTTDFAISHRLYDSEGTMALQRDAVPGSANLVRTSGWWTGEVVDILFHLDFLDSLDPGEYELRLIVYDADKLTPTVASYVWKPEFVLARLRHGESRGMADHLPITLKSSARCGVLARRNGRRPP